MGMSSLIFITCNCIFNSEHSRDHPSLFKQKDITPFPVASVLLRLATLYEATTIRREVIRALQTCWPCTLTAWEMREKDATDADGVYSPRVSMAHPM